MIHAPILPAVPAAPRVEWTTRNDGLARAEVFVGDYKVTLTERSSGDYREYSKTTRVYGAIDALVPEFTEEEPYQGISIPFAPESPVDKMRASVWNAWKRATTAEAAKRLAEVLKGLYEFDGLTIPASAVESIKFSQKAGCTMCPCSPGFVLGGVLRSQRNAGSYTAERNLDIYIEEITK